MKPHKHAETIKAWADGARIQYFGDGKWIDFSGYSPAFGQYDWRIKPEPKPDVVITYTVELSQRPDSQGKHLNFWVNRIDDNVRFTFDGETGQLKAAEVLK